MRKTKWEKARFVAWDSEGITRPNGEHITILLANSEGISISSTDGLSTARMLSFLADCLTEFNDAIHVIYAGGYDANMILRDVPQWAIARLWNGEPIYIRTSNSDIYRVVYVPRKSLTVHVRRNGNGAWKGGTIWDVFGFFQSSFLKALHNWGVPIPEKVEWGKQARARFSEDQLSDIRTYTFAECRALVELMRRLHAALTEAELRISRWDGAGAIAGALLRREGVREHMPARVPSEVELAARHAYFGGRIELLQYGHTTDSVYIADIRSAYPHATRYLPCLKHGQWVHIRGHGWSAQPFTLYRVRWDHPRGRVAYPLPWRARDGSVYFPPSGEGWYWACELDAAWESGDYKIIERWEWVPKCSHKPFAFVSELYNIRRQWNASGRTNAGLVLKLGLNSLYGKMAQQIGARSGPPAYHCLLWAGYITAHTRAMLWAAARELIERGSLIAFATDAIHSTERPNLSYGDELGQWDLTIAHSGTYVQSGVYWYGSGANERVKYRGLDPRTLTRDSVLAAWRQRRYSLTLPHTRFVGMGRALRGNDWWSRWCRWHTEDREIALYPSGKRSVLPGDRPDRSLCMTLATDPVWDQSIDLMSTPVDLAWHFDGTDVRAGGVERIDMRAEAQTEFECVDE